jgi:hypothetical protein
MPKRDRIKRTVKVEVETLPIDGELLKGAEKAIERAKKIRKRGRKYSGGGWSLLDEGMRRERRAHLFG